jgi:hypothetical protein
MTFAGRAIPVPPGACDDGDAAHEVGLQRVGRAPHFALGEFGRFEYLLTESAKKLLFSTAHFRFEFVKSSAVGIALMPEQHRV